MPGRGLALERFRNIRAWFNVNRSGRVTLTIAANVGKFASSKLIRTKGMLAAGALQMQDRFLGIVQYRRGPKQSEL
jgi:hypothetical protein